MTRRKILSALSDEPMYFNQLAKELGIGQQSILRHMQALEEGGIVRTYEEKSDLGAPNRKYYCLSSVFSLNISMSQDSFSIAPHIIQKRNNDKNNDNYNRQLKTSEANQKGSINTEIASVRKNLLIVENEISDLESRLDALRALKQIALHRLHEVGKDNFEHLERRILYRIIEDQSLASISELADELDETESHVRDAVNRLQKKLDKNSIKLLFS